MVERIEVFDINCVYILLIGIIYDICSKNYIINNIINYNYTTIFLSINIIGLYLFLKYVKLKVGFKIDISFN